MFTSWVYFSVAMDMDIHGHIEGYLNYLCRDAGSSPHWRTLITVTAMSAGQWR